jgi:hypothetical protein
VRTDHLIARLLLPLFVVASLAAQQPSRVFGRWLLVQTSDVSASLPTVPLRIQLDPTEDGVLLTQWLIDTNRDTGARRLFPVFQQDYPSKQGFVYTPLRSAWRGETLLLGTVNDPSTATYAVTPDDLLVVETHAARVMTRSLYIRDSTEGGN